MAQPDRPARTCLYRLFDVNENLLYVGISKSALLRLGQHLGEKSWADEVARTTLEWFETRSEASAAEVAAIVAERPMHNVVHNKRQKAPLDQGWPAEAMPDQCGECTKYHQDYTCHFPYSWTRGEALYRCHREHSWTCCWGHLGSGTADLLPVGTDQPWPDSRTFDCRDQKETLSSLRALGAPSTSKIATVPCQVGDCIAVGLASGDCPLGLVESTDSEVLTLALLSFMTGEFGHEYRRIRWSEVEAWTIAEYEMDGKCRVFNGARLGMWQARWEFDHLPPGLQVCQKCGHAGFVPHYWENGKQSGLLACAQCFETFSMRQARKSASAVAAAAGRLG